MVDCSCVFFFKQKTAYEMRISDWSSDGCSSDLPTIEAVEGDRVRIYVTNRLPEATSVHWHGILLPSGMDGVAGLNQPAIAPDETFVYEFTLRQHGTQMYRSEEHTSELQSLMRISYAVFCLKKKKIKETTTKLTKTTETNTR